MFFLWFSRDTLLDCYNNHVLRFSLGVLRFPCEFPRLSCYSLRCSIDMLWFSNVFMKFSVINNQFWFPNFRICFRGDLDEQNLNCRSKLTNSLREMLTPREAIGKPMNIVGKPSLIAGKPANFVGKPSNILGQPTNI